MKRLSLLFFLQIFLSAPVLWAQQVASATVERVGDYLKVEFDVDFVALRLKSSHSLLLTPVLCNGSFQQTLPSVGIYGRKRYILCLRNGGTMMSDADEISYRLKNLPRRCHYQTLVRYTPELDNATLTLRRQVFSCSDCPPFSESETEVEIFLPANK